MTGIGVRILAERERVSRLLGFLLDRAARVFIDDKGATVDVSVDADGNGSFELAVATLHTTDTITIHDDVFVGI